MGIVLLATEWHAKRNEDCIQYAKRFFYAGGKSEYRSI